MFSGPQVFPSESQGGKKLKGLSRYCSQANKTDRFTAISHMNAQELSYHKDGRQPGMVIHTEKH